MKRPLLGLALTGAAVHLAIVRKSRSLQAGDDPVPYDVLCQDLPGHSQFVDRPDGTRVHVRTAGEGPTVVLVHGFGVPMLEWNLVWASLLERGHRCVAFELRGHGLSTIGSEGAGSTQIARDYAAVFDALDLRDAVLVGHSTGGFMAIKALLDHPQLQGRLRGLVMFASLAGDVLRGSPQNRLQIPMIRAGLMGAVARSPIYGPLFAASLLGEPKSPAVMRIFCEQFGAQRLRELAPVVASLTESYYDRLHEIHVPTVVICGERDNSTPRWHSEQLGVRIPEARNVWVEGKGHLLNWEAPESLVAAIASLHRAKDP